MPARALSAARPLSVALALLAAPAVAQAPKVPPPRAPATAPDPAFEAMRAAFEALPEAERKALQDALVWTGDYNSVVNGAFGRRTFEALNAARARTAGADPLDPRSRAAILAAGEAARKAVRFAVLADPASGAVLGVPERMVPKRSAVPGGTRWQSADGRLTLESRSFPAGSTDLEALFARATAPLADRKVTYKLKRPDFIVVTGETASGRSYLRYAAGPAGIRGFAIGYEAAQAADVDRLVIAIANSFVPFPNAPAEAPRIAAVPATKPPATGLPPAGMTSQVTAPQVTPPQVVGTGLVVAPGRVLTASSVVETCPNLRVGAAPAKVLRSERGLALLEAAGLPAPKLPGLHGTSASEDRVVVAADGAGVSVAPGAMFAAMSGEARVTAPLQPGSAGAPVLDRAGGLAGLVARYPAAPRLVAGVVPPASFPVIPEDVIAAFLAEGGIATKPSAATAGSVGAAASAVGGAVIGLGCTR
ncbi:serine protease [Methylobacterium sp. WL8]|uniref:S1 family peptidase n=1 Tax=Methylobacterium sp. WL8 TaxID=2603899 RepID=UPI0011C95FFA|nr:serine protease [Methylobacterium sp. WL8]TXN82278.1 trypsin-like peptidase domain-containing protein [Methylobacterium sp. WL8]